MSDDVSKTSVRSSRSSFKESIDIDYWSRSFLALVYPVSFTVIISAGLAMFLYDLFTQPNVFEEAGLISSSRGPNAGSASTITGQAFKIALIVVGLLVIATCLLVVLVYYNCMKVLYVYLFLTVVCVFSLLNLSILSMIIAEANIPIDWITIVLFVFNILIVALISMFWISPDFIKQAATIYQCVVMILYVLKMAPEWIAWALLPLLAIWDMIAVLLPFGPLYLLINLFQKRQIEVPPMMIYTTGLWLRQSNKNSNASSRFRTDQWSMSLSIFNLIFISKSTIDSFDEENRIFNDVQNTNASKENSSSKKRRRTRKSMLGLGDFIFYSILLAKTVFTSECNLFAVIIVYLSIIMGMLATTIILVLIHRPLPALPISLLIGLGIFFQYHYIGNQFADSLRLPTGPIII